MTIVFLKTIYQVPIVRDIKWRSKIKKPRLIRNKISPDFFFTEVFFPYMDLSSIWWLDTHTHSVRLYVVGVCSEYPGTVWGFGMLEGAGINMDRIHFE